jgi:hypothetical protein
MTAAVRIAAADKRRLHRFITMPGRAASATLFITGF